MTNKKKKGKKKNKKEKGNPRAALSRDYACTPARRGAVRRVNAPVIQYDRQKAARRQAALMRFCFHQPANENIRFISGVFIAPARARVTQIFFPPPPPLQFVQHAVRVCPAF